MLVGPYIRTASSITNNFVAGGGERVELQTLPCALPPVAPTSNRYMKYYYIATDVHGNVTAGSVEDPLEIDKMKDSGRYNEIAILPENASLFNIGATLVQHYKDTNRVYATAAVISTEGHAGDGDSTQEKVALLNLVLTCGQYCSPRESEGHLVAGLLKKPGPPKIEKMVTVEVQKEFFDPYLTDKEEGKK